MPLVAAPASASLDGGGFFVHAQNIEDSKFKATAGLKGVDPSGGGGSGGGTTPGGGSGAESPGGPTDSSGVLASYQCGPMELKITQAMVDFSKANESRTPETSPDGWQSMSSFYMATRSVALGYPEGEAKALLVTLSDSMAVPAPLSLTPDTKAFAYQEGEMCQIYDRRSTPKSGDRLSYNAYPSYDQVNAPERDYYADTRWILEEGELRAVTVAKQTDGRTTVDRGVSGSLVDHAKSDSKPSVIYRGLDGSLTIQVYLKTPIDGANKVSLGVNADGSGEVQYLDHRGLTADGQQAETYAPRKNGPVTVRWNSSGDFTYLQSYDSHENFGDSAFTAAKYNELTGQSWDGSYLKGSDFDLTIPFEAVPLS